MSKIVDIHCHSPSDDPRIEEVLVVDLNTLELAPPLQAQHICVGLHPWFIDQIEYSKFKNLLNHYMTHPQFFALGEIGLDKVCDTDYEKQKNIFQQQLELAINVSVKRVIIHSVKAHSDILHIFKEKKPKQKFLIHDFYAHPQVAQEYLNYDCYFSFGKKLFDNPNAQKALKDLPIDRIFLETDDQFDYNIFDIYAQAAKILNIPEQELIELLYNNYKTYIQVK